MAKTHTSRRRSKTSGNALNHQLDDHFATAVTAIKEGDVVPFLGAGANLCARPAGEEFQIGKYLPSGAELAAYLARQLNLVTYREDEVRCPHCHKSHKTKVKVSHMQDLLRVAQYVEVLHGDGPLYKHLHHVFGVDYPPTPLHTFLASLPATLREKQYPPHLLIVTTNYDDVLERAFWNAGEAFDLVSYITMGPNRGRFVHSVLEPKKSVSAGSGGNDSQEAPPVPWPANVDAHIIRIPNEYGGLSLEQRSVILKIHGAVARASAEQSSFVITEDHYIDYLTRTDISRLLPVKLAEKLRHSHFLFFGYSLRDWNLRVILHRIWGDQELNYNSWAIQLNPEDLDKRFWTPRKVEIIGVDLADYISLLRDNINALAPRGD
jgi:hypothetical protein